MVLTIDGTGDVHALVVYYSNAQNAYIIEDYVWGSSTFSINGSPQFIDYQNNFESAINIDSDYDGYFVIVWEGQSTQILGMTGNVSSGALSLNSSSYIGSVGSGTFPDVCLSNHSNDSIHYCYLESGRLYVDMDSYSSLSMGVSANSLINSYTPLCTFAFGPPRIACPNPNVGNAMDWAMVVSEYKIGTAYNIYMYNNDFSNGLVGPIICNDGTWFTSPPYPDLTSEDNYNPVVTYDDQSNIYVGWNMNNLSTILNTPGATWESIYPIVLLCGVNGPATNAPYWDVPQNGNNSEIRDYLSLSGKNAANYVLCSYYFNDGSDVETKSVLDSPNNPGLRTHPSSYFENSEQENLSKFKDYDNLNMIIYELTGRIVMNNTVTYQELLELLNPSINYQVLMKNKLYLLQISTNDGKFYYRTKRFIY